MAYAVAGPRVSRWVPAFAGTTVRGARGIASLSVRLSRQFASVNGRVFGVHPRGEFRTRERPKANRYMGRASGLSFPNAEDLSEQRGWTSKARASPSKPKAAPAAGHMHSLSQRFHIFRQRPPNSAKRLKSGGSVDLVLATVHERRGRQVAKIPRCNLLTPQPFASRSPP